MESAHIVQYLYASAALGHLTAAHCRELLQSVIERDLLPNLTLVQAKARFLLKVSRRRDRPLDSSACAPLQAHFICCIAATDRKGMCYWCSLVLSADVVDLVMACWGLACICAWMDH